MTSEKFKSEKEEVEYWNKIDTTTLDLEEVELEYEPGIPDNICAICGKEMEERKMDVDVFGGKITIHGVKEFYCKKCNRFTIGSEEAERLSQILARLQQQREDRILESICVIDFDQEGYFVRIPIELAERIGIEKKERAKICVEGKRVLLEFE
jgi:hypothetical protein